MASAADVARFESAVANWALKWAGGDSRKAASVLGIDPSKLNKKLLAPPPAPVAAKSAGANAAKDAGTKGAATMAAKAAEPQVRRGRGRPRKEVTLELSPQEAQVVQHRLLGARMETFQEIGKRLDLTSERARQLMVAADEKLLARAKLLYASHPLVKKLR